MSDESIDLQDADESTGSKGRERSKPDDSAITRLKDMLPGVGAAFGIVAALWYGVLSLLCEFVYQPVGVQPREVGLSSGGVLAQAGSGVAAYIIFLLVYTLGYAFITSSWIKSRRAKREREIAALSDTERTPEELRKQVLELDPPRRGFPPRFFALYGVTALVGAFFPLVYSGFQGRSQLSDGTTPTAPFYFVSVPWEASVAYPHWAIGNPGSVALPSCALYLGQADSTVVLYYLAGPAKHRTKNTLRLPAASVVLRLEPGAHKCPDASGHTQVVTPAPVSTSSSSSASTPTPPPTKMFRVPILRGKTLEQARSLLRAHFKLGPVDRVEGTGVLVNRILGSRPGEGTSQKAGTAIGIRIRKASNPTPEPCPPSLCMAGNG